MNLSRSERSASSRLSQVDVNSIPQSLLKLGSRCAVCKVPERAFNSFDEFRSHREECRPLKRRQGCLGGIYCASAASSHYKDFNHDDLGRYFSKIPVDHLQSTQQFFSENFDHTETTPSRGGFEEAIDWTNVPIPVKMEDDYKTPAISPTSPHKKNRRLAEDSEPVPKQRKVFDERSQNSGQPKKETVLKEFPLGPVQNISKRLDTLENSLERCSVEEAKERPGNVEVWSEADKENSSEDSTDPVEAVEETDLSCEEEMRDVDDIEREMSQFAEDFVCEDDVDARLFWRVDTPVQEEPEIPDFKILPGTKIAVNCFEFGEDRQEIDFYFLTSFHPKHYRGLSGTWSKSIFCSAMTGDLLIQQLHVSRNCVVKVPMNKPTECSRGGFTVTMLDANHSPGAVMLLFKFDDGKTLLHTGSFRASRSMESYKDDWGMKDIDYLYLGAKYLTMKYELPSREEASSAIVQCCAKELEKESRTLFVCGTDVAHFGLEKVWMDLADKLKAKVWLDERSRKIVRLLNDEMIEDSLGDVMEDCQLHVVPMEMLTVENLRKYWQSLGSPSFNCVVGIKVHASVSKIGGELFERQDVGEGQTIYVVPYSNHSAYSEVRQFVEFFQPKAVVSVVGNVEERQACDGIVNDWLASIRIKEASMVRSDFASCFQ